MGHAAGGDGGDGDGGGLEGNVYLMIMRMVTTYTSAAEDNHTPAISISDLVVASISSSIRLGASHSD